MFDKEELQTIYDALCYYAKKEDAEDVDYLIGKVLSIMGIDIYPPNNQEG